MYTDRGFAVVEPEPKNCVLIPFPPPAGEVSCQGRSSEDKPQCGLQYTKRNGEQSLIDKRLREPARGAGGPELVTIPFFSFYKAFPCYSSTPKLGGGVYCEPAKEGKAVAQDTVASDAIDKKWRWQW